MHVESQCTWILHFSASQVDRLFMGIHLYSQSLSQIVNIHRITTVYSRLTCHISKKYCEHPQVKELERLVGILCTQLLCHCFSWWREKKNPHAATSIRSELGGKLVLASLFEKEWKVSTQFTAVFATKREKSDVKCFISHFSTSDGWGIHNFYSVLQKYLTSLCGTFYICDFLSYVSFTGKVIWSQVRCDNSNIMFSGEKKSNRKHILQWPCSLLEIFGLQRLAQGHFNMLTVDSRIWTADPPVIGQVNFTISS